MELSMHREIDRFFKPLDDCQGTIYLMTKYGDVYNLKSKIGQFSAISVLVNEPKESMYLNCSLHEEQVFLKTYLFSKT